MAQKPAQEVPLEDIFNAYVAYGKSAKQKSQLKEMDGRTLVKLAKQAKLVNKKCRTNDIDLLFAKHKTKGKRSITFAQFQEILKGIAARTGKTPEKVQQSVIYAGLPKSPNATKADKVKFHDDKALYTGVHGKGGPDTGNSNQTLDGLLDRSAADVRGIKKK